MQFCCVIIIMIMKTYKGLSSTIQYNVVQSQKS